jgi:hypothetical protein
LALGQEEEARSPEKAGVRGCGWFTAGRFLRKRAESAAVDLGFRSSGPGEIPREIPPARSRRNSARPLGFEWAHHCP